MFNRIKGLFSRQPTPADYQAWDEEKSKLMAASLGQEHDHVMHAIIPFAVGGGLDLYYFTNGNEGTAIATKELSELPDRGPTNRDFSCYELVMFTRHALNLERCKDDQHEFGRAHRQANQILNPIARYSGQAVLNPGETCEFPAELPDVGGKCLIFAFFASHPNGTAKNFGLLAVIEIHRSEMAYARREGGGALIAKLRERGYFPYSDLDRPAVA